MFKEYKRDLMNEFSGYNAARLKKDVMAGITVTAVALPLALAFGVSCGASAAAGLITAIIAGLVIGALSGASFQISGPTGAMSAVLVLLFQQYGLEGIWVAGALAGILLIIAGVCKLGKLVSYIPAPVITGFTSGIALIIAIGQLNNFFGVSIKGADSAIMQLVHFIKGPVHPNWYAVLLGALVIGVMIIWPKKWNAVIPSSLIGLIIALAVNMTLNLPVEVIGSIPKKVLLDERLTFAAIDIHMIKNLMMPALTIAVLGMIESLLCGEVAKKMKGEKFDANRELVAQGIGNFIIPFFGGVPATAAIARTSVGIKSGGETRLVSIFHAVFLLLSMFLLAPFMSKIPLAALAGVLMVTAWRMNEWENIKYIFSKRFKGAMAKFLITMSATVVLDLTQAIFIGVIFSCLLFMVKISDADICVSEVDVKKLENEEYEKKDVRGIKVAYFTGPLFFGTVERLKSEISTLENTEVLILSMRGVPLIDTSGIQALEELRVLLEEKQCKLMICGLQKNVKRSLYRSGLYDTIGEQMVFWSADQAIVAAEKIA